MELGLTWGKNTRRRCLRTGWWRESSELPERKIEKDWENFIMVNFPVFFFTVRQISLRWSNIIRMIRSGTAGWSVHLASRAQKEIPWRVLMVKRDGKGPTDLTRLLYGPYRNQYWFPKHKNTAFWLSVVVSPCNRQWRPTGGVEVKLYSFFNLGDGWGGWSESRLGRFTPGNAPVPMV